MTAAPNPTTGKPVAKRELTRLTVELVRDDLHFWRVLRPTADTTLAELVHAIKEEVERGEEFGNPLANMGDLMDGRTLLATWTTEDHGENMISTVIESAEAVFDCGDPEKIQLL